VLIYRIWPFAQARNAWVSKQALTKEHLMLDVVMLVLGFGFFAAAIGYTYACERL
jgi:hypothetical protein